MSAGVPKIQILYFLQELNDGACIVDFAELQLFAVQKKKLIITDEELVFPTHNLKTINSIRSNLQKQMDDLALQEQKLKDKIHKNRNVRVELNAKKLDFITTLFGVGKILPCENDKKLIVSISRIFLRKVTEN